MDAQSKPIKVVLADDNIDLTSVLRRLLELEPDIECVGCVADARDVVEEVARWEPQVLVIDLSMPGGDIATIVSDLHMISPGLRTIVFSGFSDDERIDRSMAAGACRFVCKDDGLQELVDAIRNVASDPMPTSP
ncbi:MAG: response regulator transcription factor [Phycisphaerales bacterium]|nr:response regulator transcription factor [Phycisphaerales bacterium]